MTRLASSLYQQNADTDTISNHTFEATAIKIRVNHSDLVIITVYRPPPTSIHGKEFTDLWQSYFISLHLENTPFIIVGDFNFPTIDWANYIVPGNLLPSEFLSFCLLNGLEQHVTEPTHKLGNLLDLALSSESGLISQVNVYSPIIDSDHLQIKLKLNICIPSITSDNGYFQYYKGNYQSIERNLIDIDWKLFFFECTSASEMYDKFCSLLLSQVNQFIPFKKSNSKNNRKKWPSNIRHLKYEKDILFRRYQKRNYQDKDKLKYLNKNNEFRQAVRNYIYHQELAVLQSGNDKKFWSFIRSKTSSIPPIPAIKINGNIITDNLEKAEAFNSYFATNFTKDNGNSPPINHKRPFAASQLSSCSFDPVTIFDKLNNLPCKTSVGPDGIPPILLKKLSAVLSLPLSMLYEKSFQSGLIPSLWKQAIVVPVHKKGSKTSVINYRPISLTSVPCKILEQILCERITSYLKANNLLSNAQHGFLAKRSTITQLTLSVNEWTLAIDSGKLIDVAFLDFAHAFDSVSHQKLLVILDRVGLRGNLLTWIRNYLSNRSQKVRIESSISSEVDVISSTPQGTCLGPLLFLIFINDLPDIITQSSAYLFADDCKLHFAFKKGQNPDVLQNDLLKIQKWSSEMQLSLSVTKCAILSLGSRKKVVPHTYSIGNTNLEHVSSMRDLGIIMSNDLKWANHCATTAKKASVRMNCLLRTFESKSTVFLLNLYKTFVRPKLEYASQVWSPYILKDIHLIESVQRKFTSRLPELAKLQLSYPDRLSHLNLERLDLRRLKSDLVLVHKLLYNYCDIPPAEVSSLFPYHSNAVLSKAAPSLRDTSKNTYGSMTSDNTMRLLGRHVKTTVRKHSFFVRSVDVWNSLDPEIRSTGNHCMFKKYLNNSVKDQKLVNLTRFLTKLPISKKRAKPVPIPKLPVPTP